MNARSLQSVLVLLAQILGPFGQTCVFFINLAEFFYKFTENGEFLNRWFLRIRGKNRDACSEQYVELNGDKIMIRSEWSDGVQDFSNSTIMDGYSAF